MLRWMLVIFLALLLISWATPLLRRRLDQKFALAGRDRGFVEHYGAKIDRSSQIAPTRGSFSAPFTTDDKGNVRVGEIKSDGLYGRYKNSMVGLQRVISEAGKGKEIQFSFQGAGYAKKA